MQTNPFATRFIQPGAIAYKRFDGGSVAELAQRFLELSSKRGSIVGPHGSGKSTLISSLVQEFKSHRPDLKIHQLRFSSNESTASSLNCSLRGWRHSEIVILDGYEQLTVWSKIKVAWTARIHSIHVLATAHQSISRFETLWETSVSETSSQWVVEQLLADRGGLEDPSELLKSEEWVNSRAKHGQNLRESLFDMYDWWQRRL